MGLDLRPLTLAELLDRSFSTYKRHLWLFVGIMAIPSSITLLYAVGMQVFQFALGFPDAAGASPAAQIPPERLMLMFVPMFVGAVLFGLLYIVMYAFALGATTIAVARIYRDLPVTVGGAYRDVRRHGWRLMLLMLWIVLRLGGVSIGLMTLSTIVGFFFAFITPVLTGLTIFAGMLVSLAVTGFLAIRYGVAVPAVVLEELPAGKALARSVQLTHEHRGRVFLLILCAVVITYAAAALLQGPFMMAAIFAGPGTVAWLVLSVVGAVLGAVGGMFCGPIMIIGLAMIYYDLRIRKEALDLQMMLEALDAPQA